MNGYANTSNSFIQNNIPQGQYVNNMPNGYSQSYQTLSSNQNYGYSHQEFPEQQSIQHMYSTSQIQSYNQYNHQPQNSQEYRPNEQHQGNYPDNFNQPHVNYMTKSQNVPTSGSYNYSNSPTIPPTCNLQSSRNQQNMTKPDISDQMSNMNLSSVQEPTIDLMQHKNLFTNNLYEDISYQPKTHHQSNCDPSIMQCTLNTIPVDSNLLSKCRLPMGIHIHPFRDINETHLVTTNTIVRCRACRTYINPFVGLTDHQRRWHCNVCGKLNDLPDEFMYDPITKAYSSPLKRPELQHCNIEYTANPEYSIRPPVATTYVFCLDVSRTALNTNYLPHITELFANSLSEVPGDRRTQIAFITYNSAIHFYQIQENSYKQMIWADLDTSAEVPCSVDDLLVSLHERRDIIQDFLLNLSDLHSDSYDNGNCMGYAIQVATKILKQNGGGRLTFVNGSLPNIGPGALKPRENHTSSNVSDIKTLLQPSIDYYKTTALQCVNDQVSVDLFCFSDKSQQFTDIASISQLSRHSSGCFNYYSNLNMSVFNNGENNIISPIELIDADRFIKDFRRYLTRDIGFEAVMRTRCNKELEITAFHGNLFMRSTDVIALPVVNPDVSFAVQFKHRGSLSEWTYVIIQAALLYTTCQSERRIRVHTICLPVGNRIETVFENANGPAIAGLIAKLAIDRCLTDDLICVREAFINSLADPLRAYNALVSRSTYASRSLLIPYKLRLIVPYILGLLRCFAFRANNNRHSTLKSSISIDERAATLEYIRSLPLVDILRRIYPCLISVNELAEKVSLRLLANGNKPDCKGEVIGEVEEDNFIRPKRLNLTNSELSRDGAYLMDTGLCSYLLLGPAVPDNVLKNLNITNANASELLTDTLNDFSNISNPVCRRLATVLSESSHDRQLGTTVISVGTNGVLRSKVLSHLIEDRMDDAMSYYEFLTSVQSTVHS